MTLNLTLEKTSQEDCKFQDTHRLQSKILSQNELLLRKISFVAMDGPCLAQANTYKLNQWSPKVNACPESLSVTLLWTVFADVIDRFLYDIILDQSVRSSHQQHMSLWGAEGKKKQKRKCYKDSIPASQGKPGVSRNYPEMEARHGIDSFRAKN